MSKRMNLGHRPRFVSAPDSWKERVKSYSPSDSGHQKVSILFEESSDRCEKQLDPRCITVQYLIESGVQITPSDVMSMFNFTDPADINQLADNLSSEAFEYIVKNHPLYDGESNTLINKEV